MRISDLACALVVVAPVAACGSASETPQSMVAKADIEDRGVACRRGQGRAFADSCTIEPRGRDAEGRSLMILRHSDGGFRRVLVSQNGEIGQADGSEPIRLTARTKAGIEVAIGEDMYRLRASQLRLQAP